MLICMEECILNPILVYLLLVGKVPALGVDNGGIGDRVAWFGGLLATAREEPVILEWMEPLTSMVVMARNNFPEYRPLLGYGLETLVLVKSHNT